MILMPDIAIAINIEDDEFDKYYDIMLKLVKNKYETWPQDTMKNFKSTKECVIDHETIELAKKRYIMIEDNGSTKYYSREWFLDSRTQRITENMENSKLKCLKSLEEYDFAKDENGKFLGLLDEKHKYVIKDWVIPVHIRTNT